MEVAKALGGSFKLASAKTCKGEDSTAQGNIKGWGHTNKLKQYKHTKYKPRLNKTLGPTGLCELVLVAVHMENETSNVQPKCQGPEGQKRCIYH